MTSPLTVIATLLRNQHHQWFALLYQDGVCALKQKLLLDVVKFPCYSSQHKGLHRSSSLPQDCVSNIIAQLKEWRASHEDKQLIPHDKYVSPSILLCPF